MKSHLLQMRGLKQEQKFPLSNIDVASFTDAWIETKERNIIKLRKESHLLQMRGLKLLIILILLMSHLSHLLQMRGLKLNSSRETRYAIVSHLLQMRGLKLTMGRLFLKECWSHLLQMRGLKHKRCCSKERNHSRIFYRCVD